MQVQSLPSLNRKERRALSSQYRRGLRTMPRKPEEIQQEYSQLCAQAGERAFQIKVWEAEIEKTQKRIVELGKEMQEAQANASKPVEEKTDEQQVPQQS